MKKNIWKQLRTAALAGVLSLALLGCGEKNESEQAPETQETEEGAESRPESDEPQEPEQKDVPENEDDSAERNEEPVGEITELGDGQFTIKKFILETGEDGTEMMAAPAEGAEDDGTFETLTVLYDENTHFYKRTIRNGGADYEDEESSAEKLEKGMQTDLKGNYEGEMFHASEVQIVEVIF